MKAAHSCLIRVWTGHFYTFIYSGPLITDQHLSLLLSFFLSLSLSLLLSLYVSHSSLIRVLDRTFLYIYILPTTDLHLSIYLSLSFFLSFFLSLSISLTLSVCLSLLPDQGPGQDIFIRLYTLDH